MKKTISDSLPSICFLIIVKNTTEKSSDNFKEVIEKASLISKKFIIIDNGSTDGTKKVVLLLKKNNHLDLTYILDKNPHYDTLRYQYIQQIKEDYIFILDDDEIISEKLRNEIITILKKKRDYVLFFIKIWTHFNGEIIDYNSVKPCLFKSKINILANNKNLHSQWNKSKIRSIHKNKIYKSRYGLLHYSFPTINYYLKKINRYTEYEAKQLYEENPSLSSIRLLFFLFYKMLHSAIYHLFVIRRMYTSLNAFIYAMHNIVIYPTQILLYYLEIKKDNKKALKSKKNNFLQ